MLPAIKLKKLPKLHVHILLLVHLGKDMIHRVLAEKLNLNYEVAERWIVNLIWGSKLDAKIDSESGIVVMEPNHPKVYEQLIDHTKALSGRTYKLVSQLLEHAKAQIARLVY
ncbi:eukaryotic translation initiation factor 3 subunit E-like [Quercus robur]|uniref:eukaryotic translation initiation factor 3 subunit E-like n=1 Tax=Quercus robur TaxID=38942 RepID=UPI00216341B0|nr:eukaryotic translation initiation factor 3 subunit E-like [Quercus robur]